MAVSPPERGKTAKKTPGEGRDIESDNDMQVEDLQAAGMAAGAGLIAVGTLAVEIWTAQMPARTLGFEGGFVSVPIGIAAPILAALAARNHVPSALPAVAASATYWIVALLYW